MGTALLVIAIVVFAAVVLLSLVRMAWRLARGNEEMVPGGSYGRQFGRKKPDDR